LRLNIQDESLNSKMDSFKFEENRITNLEMETAAIYGLSTLLGHNALSQCHYCQSCFRTFSADPYKAVDELIAYTLDRLAENALV
jgi:uridine phosphorylase